MWIVKLYRNFKCLPGLIQMCFELDRLSRYVEGVRQSLAYLAASMNVLTESLGVRCEICQSAL